jgi:hypothetical protein
LTIRTEALDIRLELWWHGLPEVAIARNRAEVFARLQSDRLVDPDRSSSAWITLSLKQE